MPYDHDYYLDSHGAKRCMYCDERRDDGAVGECRQLVDATIGVLKVGDAIPLDFPRIFHGERFEIKIKLNTPNPSTLDVVKIETRVFRKFHEPVPDGGTVEVWRRTE